MKTYLCVYSCVFFIFFLASLALVEARGSRSKLRRNNKEKFFSAALKSDDSSASLQETRLANHRAGRLFSLFNVVNFDNDQCRTNVATETRFGTCYTDGECRNRGGAQMGNCAAGFGSCCVFTINGATGGTVSENCTYLQNPNFPMNFGASTNVAYTINKMANCDICFLRLDFQTFTINGVANSLETAGGACNTDTFTVTGTNGQAVPVICGQNTGQHMYLNFGAGAGASIMLNFAFSMMDAATRMWDIKVAQIPCQSDYSPPSGCLQYFFGDTMGMFMTFNFIDGTTTQTHLANQMYSACIRQEAGFCCVNYSECGIGQFTLSGVTPLSMADALCTGVGLDTIGIRGSSAACSFAAPPVNLNNMFCGNVFSPVSNAVNPTCVCDCTGPFGIDVNFDNLGGANAFPSRGACLKFSQIMC